MFSFYSVKTLNVFIKVILYPLTDNSKICVISEFGSDAGFVFSHVGVFPPVSSMPYILLLLLLKGRHNILGNRNWDKKAFSVRFMLTQLGWACLCLLQLWCQRLHLPPVSLFFVPYFLQVTHSFLLWNLWTQWAKSLYLISTFQWYKDYIPPVLLKFSDLKMFIA